MRKPSQSPTRRYLLETRAAQHRHAPSEPERVLWSALSGGKLGVSFRRQVVLGEALADFFAPFIRLVVEVDGVQHARRRTADARRDRDLARLGCHVLRIQAHVVLRDLPRAVDLVQKMVTQLGTREF